MSLQAMLKVVGYRKNILKRDYH